MNNNRENLVGILIALWAWRKHIVAICVVVGVATAIVSLLLPNYFKATTLFYAASTDLAKPAPIGELDQDRDYYGEAEDIDRILTIANSNEVAGYLIGKYNLYQHYDIDSTDRKAPYKVQKAFWKLYSATKTKYDAIEISIEDEVPALAAEMANDARYKISETAQRLVKQSQYDQIKAYEHNIADKEKELGVLGDSLSSMRKKYKVYNTETQSEVLATLLAKAQANLARNQARLSVMEQSSNVRRDTVINLKAGIKGLEKEVSSIGKSLALFNEGMARVEVLAELHEEASEQLGLDKERYKQLRAIHESGFPAIHLVEVAHMPIVKSRPKRTILVLAATFIAFVLSVMGVLLIDGYKNLPWPTDA